MRVLVTGGAGFIGSHLVLRLVEDGHSVRVVDDFSTGKPENLSAIGREVQLFEGDIRDFAIVERAVRGVEVVFHQAARCSVPRSVEDPLATNEVNVTGTLNVLLAAKDGGVRRVVFASSSSVYGADPTLPKREDMPTEPLSPYAVSKLTGEHYCRVFNQLYGLETVALRYFNVFGPRQSWDSQYAAVIPRFTQAILNGQPVTVYGDGEQSRDFTYVDNVVDANVLAMRSPTGMGEAFNIACAATITINQLIRDLAGLIGRKADVVYQGARSGDIRHSLADIGKAMSMLGYQPRVDFLEGLRRTVAWATSRART